MIVSVLQAILKLVLKRQVNKHKPQRDENQPDSFTQPTGS